MPLTSKDRQMREHFREEYGDRGDEMYYRTLNKRISEGRAIDSPESRRMKARRRKRAKSRARRRRTR